MFAFNDRMTKAGASIMRSLLALPFLGLAGVSTTTPASAEYPGMMISGVELCLDVARSEMGKKGGRVLAWECHGGDNQQWTIEGKRGLIRSSTGMCLDASRSNMHKNGARVMIWPCHGGPNQQWTFAGEGLRNGSGKCLDISRKSLRKSGGTKGKIILWDCHFKDNQQWRFEEAGFTAPTATPVIGAPVYGTPNPPQKKGSLPHLSQIPAGAPTAMDGLWKLTANNIPYKIEAGRLYAMAEYMHMFIFPVEAHDVVVKDIVQTGPGQLSGQDLALLGPWTGRLQGDGTIAITVQGALGPFTSTLTPIQITDPQWFEQERASLSGGYRPPPRLPGPPPELIEQPPVAPVPPSAGDGGLYPPGWGD